MVAQQGRVSPGAGESAEDSGLRTLPSETTSLRFSGNAEMSWKDTFFQEDTT